MGVDRRIRYDESDYGQALQACAAAHGGHTPTARQFDLWRGQELAAERRWPAKNSYLKRYGSWAAACTHWRLEPNAPVAAPPTRRRHPYHRPDHDLLVGLGNCYSATGSTSKRDYDLWRSRHRAAAPSITVIGRFGGWNRALDAAGLPWPPRSRSPFSRDEHLLALVCSEALVHRSWEAHRRWWREHGRTLGLPSPDATCRALGGRWSAALETADRWWRDGGEVAQLVRRVRSSRPPRA